MDQPESAPKEVDHFLYRLIPPRPTFAFDMTAAEGAIMERHFGYWRELLDEQTAIVYGPVADPAGSWGLAVVRAEHEEDVRRLGSGDPAVSSGMATFEIFPMPNAIAGATDPNTSSES